MDNNIIYLPLNVAWKMRAKWAYPGDMSPKRTDITMSRIEAGMKEGRFDPIPATTVELEKGILSEGKHRLIIAKKLGIKQIPIIITDKNEDNIIIPELLDTMSELYDKNVVDIKKGLYGEYIKTNDDGTFKVVDAVLGKTLKIVDNTVRWAQIGLEKYSKWFEAIPIISIKDSRYEQKFFENRTQMPVIDEIFKSPDYSYRAKSKIAIVEYMIPMEYIEKCAIGFGITLEKQLEQVNIETIKKYAKDMLKGDLFPMTSITHYEDGSIDQEGRHRAMAVQHLIDTKAIPEDTLIPVVIVTEV